ncbi:hypothetical protein [Rufibacter roseus]|uniref:hypothetical protein n=1 Tax=Rufibacter roseus TaxID=1567108 RepID=UPI003672FF6F
MRCSIAEVATANLNLYLVLPLSASAPSASALPAPAGNSKEGVVIKFVFFDSGLATQDSELIYNKWAQSVCLRFTAC